MFGPSVVSVQNIGTPSASRNTPSSAHANPIDASTKQLIDHPIPNTQKHPTANPSFLPSFLTHAQTQGENARMASFVGAIAIADLVKTTLGPKGMDKILQSVRLARRVFVGGGGGWRRGVADAKHNAQRGGPFCLHPPPTIITPTSQTQNPQVSSPDGAITVTNDGATILKAVHIDNPAAKVLVDIAKTQVGRGGALLCRVCGCMCVVVCKGGG